MASPQAIQDKFLPRLREYFANPKVIVHPESGMIVAYTCMHGVGPELPVKMAQAVMAEPDTMSQLKMIQLAPIFGGANYNFVIIGFDNGFIRYDTHAGTFQMAAPRGNYKANYESVCATP